MVQQGSVSDLFLPPFVQRIAQKKIRDIKPSSIEKIVFTKEMRKDYTILCPQMSPVHFSLLEAAFNANDYHLEILPNDNKHAVDVGLKYVT